ncbi:MAG: diguanylate cyclase [Candidatus Omnitrophica bacterium]|nr:diguanylate cyclase [Candidatus Omnitrophota bacterium]
MASFLRKLSLIPQGLRYKLLIAFTLMSIIPLLVLVYLVSNYVFVQESVSVAQISVVVLLSIIIAWLGLILAKTLVEPVIDMSIEAKIIASGDFDRKIHIATEDEIGELGTSINLLSRRIKDNIQELRDYGEKTREINFEIQRKMLALSNLLQIGDLISNAADLNRVLDVALEKLSHFYDNGFAVAYLPKDKIDEFSMSANSNVYDSELLGIKIRLGDGFLGMIGQKKKIVVIDSSTPHGSAGHTFRNQTKIMNVVIIPLYTGNICRGLLLMGNRIKDFAYTNEDIDTIKVFAKQLSIAVENDMLLRKAASLSIKDELTGLYNRNFIRPRLNEEIGRAMLYQRPCSFVVINIDDFNEFRNKRGQLVAESALKKISEVLKACLGPIDKAARIGDDEFALLLPEKNKRSASDVAEKLRKDISCLAVSDDKKDTLTVSIGVSENPLDGSTSDELMAKAFESVKKAKVNGKNKVVM